MFKWNVKTCEFLGIGCGRWIPTFMHGKVHLSRGPWNTLSSIFEKQAALQKWKNNALDAN